jgi:hypothetical protein
MARRAPHLDKLQPMSKLLRASPLLWWRPWSRLCSLAFVATILGSVLTHAEQSPGSQETSRTSVSESCATEPPAVDAALCHDSALETLAWAPADEHRGVCAGDASTELSLLHQEANPHCAGPGEEDSIVFHVER